MNARTNTSHARPIVLISLGACSLLASSAVASPPYAIDWWNLDGSGTTVASTGGAYAIAGTCGQPDAGIMAGGAYTITGGFWAIAASTSACYANCDGSTTSPVLSAADFVCFLNKFRSGDSYANCDGSTTTPVLSAADFVCFLGKFRAGCP
jgi:hypothetical protein